MQGHVLPDHRRVNKAKLIIDIDIAFQPRGGVPEFYWSKCVGEGKRGYKMRLTYWNGCAWDRDDVGEADF